MFSSPQETLFPIAKLAYLLHLLFSFLSFLFPYFQNPHDDAEVLETSREAASKAPIPDRPERDIKMEEPRGIMRLSNELFMIILDFLAQDLEKCITVDSRAHLSIESFGRLILPEPPQLWIDAKTEDLRSDIDRFREVCKRFAEIGAAHKFSRVVVRFSEPAFRRLDLLSGIPRLAQHAKTFTYIIRSFYVEGNRKQFTSSLSHADRLDGSYVL